MVDEGWITSKSTAKSGGRSHDRGSRNEFGSFQMECSISITPAQSLLAYVAEWRFTSSARRPRGRRAIDQEHAAAGQPRHVFVEIAGRA